jgi:hypothetical protein
MPKSSNSYRKVLGQPFSSRFKPDDHVAVGRARELRKRAVALLHSIEDTSALFESEKTQFLEIVKYAPSALGESAAQLQDLAGVGPRSFDDWLRYGRRPSRGSAMVVLTAIVDTANERLLDVEGPLASRWIDNPYTLDTVRDLQGALSQIITYLATSNSISQVPELDDVSRRNLINLCKTIIALLESPRVELGLFERCARLLKPVAVLVGTTALATAVSVAVTQLMQPSEACHRSAPSEQT